MDTKELEVKLREWRTVLYDSFGETYVVIVPFGKDNILLDIVSEDYTTIEHGDIELATCGAKTIDDAVEKMDVLVCTMIDNMTNCCKKWEALKGRNAIIDTFKYCPYCAAEK